MKYLIYTLLVLFFTNCENPKESTDDGVSEQSPDTPMIRANDDSDARYGREIAREGAVPANTILEHLRDKDSLDLKIRGEITSVCQKKGCWMMMDIGNEEKMRISFKDYGFFVPKDIDGQYAVVEGVVRKETTDVATLQHFAQDAGKSESEIEAITEPEENLVFVAEGVIIEQKL